MVFNISSLVDRGYSRIDTERKEARKEKFEKTGKTESTVDIGNGDKAAVSRFERVGKIEFPDKSTGISQGNERNLSEKAKQMLEELRAKYGDLDIFVGNTEDDLQALTQYGNKEFSVIFTNTELERMADESAYHDSQIKSMEAALEEAKSIAFKLFEEGDKTQVNSFSISFAENGLKKFFANLEKRPETSMEKVAERKHISRFDSYIREQWESVKRTTVSAATADELMDKIRNVNWEEIEETRNGDRYNYSV